MTSIIVTAVASVKAVQQLSGISKSFTNDFETTVAVIYCSLGCQKCYPMGRILSLKEKTDDIRRGKVKIMLGLIWG